MSNARWHVAAESFAETDRYKDLWHDALYGAFVAGCKQAEMEYEEQLALKRAQLYQIAEALEYAVDLLELKIPGSNVECERARTIIAAIKEGN